MNNIPQRQTGGAAFRTALLIVTLFQLSLIFAAPAVNADSGQQAKLDALLESLQQVKSRLKKNTAKQGKLQQSIERTETEIGELAGEQRALSRQQEMLAAELATLVTQQAQLQASIDEQKVLVSEHLLKIYKTGNRNPVQLLLENGNPADIDRQLEYLARINKARNELLDNYSDLLDQQRANERETKVKQAALAENQQQLAARKQKLEKLQAERSEALAGIKDEIGSDKHELEQLEKDRLALQMLLDSMSDVMEQAPTVDTDFSGIAQHREFASAKGQLSWPVKGKLLKPADSRWQGITIASREGSSVQAIFPGRVIFSDWFTGQGLLLIVDHGEGYWSLYGRNQSLLKNEGDSVIAGETIATVGNSGGQTESALYFEIRHNGKPSNPRQWCRS